MISWVDDDILSPLQPKACLTSQFEFSSDKHLQSKRILTLEFGFSSDNTLIRVKAIFRLTSVVGLEAGTESRTISAKSRSESEPASLFRWIVKYRPTFEIFEILVIMIKSKPSVRLHRVW